jgi:ABC-type glycerol-3-phosphate transport system substrate-binding protein
MLTRRVSILGLALVMAAGAAVAGNPAPAQASKTQHSEKKTCVQRSTTGHCEKWAAPAKSDSAAKAKEQKKS